MYSKIHSKLYARKNLVLTVAGCMVGFLATAGLVTPSHAAWEPQPQQQPNAQNPNGAPDQPPPGANFGGVGSQAPTTAARQVAGSVKAINGNNVTLKQDSGEDINVVVSDTARVLRVAPGQTDLKTADKIQLTDIQVGDRVLLIGRTSSDNRSFGATTVVAMKAADVQAKQAQEQADWQRRGIGGIVSASDPSSGLVTVSATGPGGVKQAISIHVAKGTVVRRYAQGSVQFSDAKVTTLDTIKPGDQLRARGNRAGNDVTADEIVFGSFQDISGVVSSVDVAAKTMTVQDVATKKPVVVKITAQSTIVKLPPQVAQAFANRINPNAGAGQRGNRGGGAAAGGGNNAAPAQGFTRGGGPGGGGGRGGGATAADLQQIVSRQPPAALADMMKGDTVMVVASIDSASSADVTAITLVGGVDAILRAAPEQSMNLSQWNLGGGGGDQ